MVITCPFEKFGSMYKTLEEKGIVIVSAELQRIPTSVVSTLTEEEKLQVESLIERLEEDEDVQTVYSNLV